MLPCKKFLSSLLSSMPPPNASTPIIPLYFPTWPMYPIHTLTLYLLKLFKSFLNYMVLIPTLLIPTKSFTISFWVWACLVPPPASNIISPITVFQGTKSSPPYPLVSPVPSDIPSLIYVTSPVPYPTVFELPLNCTRTFKGVLHTSPAIYVLPNIHLLIFMGCIWENNFIADNAHSSNISWDIL